MSKEVIITKLTGELKDKVDAVETLDEKKAVLADVGVELTDEELVSVAGGHPLESLIKRTKKPSPEKK